MNAIGNRGAHALMAACCGQLGEIEAARRAIRQLVNLKPVAAATLQNQSTGWFDPEHSKHLIDGLRKAGLMMIEDG